MKKLSVAMAIVLLIGTVFMIDTFDLFGGKSAATEVAASVSSVTVSGEGTITVKPDIAYMQLGVSTKDADANVAQTQNKDLMAAVMAAVKAQGIADDDIKTVQYQIFQSFDYTMPVPEGQNPPMLYEVQNIIKITIKNMDSVGTILDAASKAGANVVQSIAFDSTERDAVYLEALKLAMTNAEGKAGAIMTTFNKKPGAPFKVFESSYNPGPIYRDYAMDKVYSGAEATPIQTGELEIKANVSVEYQY